MILHEVLVNITFIYFLIVLSNWRKMLISYVSHYYFVSFICFFLVISDHVDFQFDFSRYYFYLFVSGILKLSWFCIGSKLFYLFFLFVLLRLPWIEWDLSHYFLLYLFLFSSWVFKATRNFIWNFNHYSFAFWLFYLFLIS